MTGDFISFRNFMTFRLGALSRDLARYFNNHFAEYDITIGQALVLFYLTEHEGSSVKDIAQGLELDSPAVSRFIDRLIKGEMISREEDEEDRRTLKINLTEKGKCVAEKVLPITARYNRSVREKLGEDNYRTFSKCLSVIKETVK